MSGCVGCWPEEKSLAGRVMEQVMEYKVLDFSTWQDESKFGNTFNELIDSLGLFYKG